MVTSRPAPLQSIRRINQNVDRKAQLGAEGRLVQTDQPSKSREHAPARHTDAERAGDGKSHTGDKVHGWSMVR